MLGGGYRVENKTGIRRLGREKVDNEGFESQAEALAGAEAGVSLTISEQLKKEPWRLVSGRELQIPEAEPGIKCQLAGSQAHGDGTCQKRSWWKGQEKVTKSLHYWSSGEL